MSNQYTPVFIIGAAKSGTSTLYQLLSQHPQVCVSRTKEPCFFSLDEEYAKGLDYYAQQFGANSAATVHVDASVQYARCTVFPAVAQRIHSAFPTARFIYIMRHPVERAFSHYTHRWAKELHQGEPFSETFEIFSAHDPECIDDSLYDVQIKQYLQYFSQQQFLFLLTEDLNRNPHDTLASIYQHIGIDAPNDIMDDMKNIHANVGENFRETVVKNQFRQRLKQIPGLEQIVKTLLSPQLRAGFYTYVLQNNMLFKQRVKALAPLPMQAETRQQLIERYRDTIVWTENTVGQALPHWYQ